MIIKLCVWLASFRKPSLPPERKRAIAASHDLAWL